MPETYHNGLATPPMLRPSEHDMGHVNGSISHQSGQNSYRQPPKHEFGAVRKLLGLFHHGHCASSPLGERSAAWTRLIPAILARLLCCKNRVGDEGDYKGDQEDNWIACAKVNQDVSRRLGRIHGRTDPPIYAKTNTNAFNKRPSIYFPLTRRPCLLRNNKWQEARDDWETKTNWESENDRNVNRREYEENRRMVAGKQFAIPKPKKKKRTTKKQVFNRYK